MFWETVTGSSYCSCHGGGPMGINVRRWRHWRNIVSLIKPLIWDACGFFLCGKIWVPSFHPWRHLFALMPHRSVVVLSRLVRNLHEWNWRKLRDSHLWKLVFSSTTLLLQKIGSDEKRRKLRRNIIVNEIGSRNSWIHNRSKAQD